MKNPTELTPFTDAYNTPLWLARRIGYVDTDPCSNPRSWIDAGRTYSLEKKLDGLRLPWWGRTFTNWPYSSPLVWAERGHAQIRAGICAEWIILCKVDASTRWWQVATTRALAVLDRWELDRRLDYEPHPEIAARRRVARELALVARAQARAEGRKPDPVPSLKATSDFASVILHHRPEAAPPLPLADVATLWRLI